ncbi:thioesterase family protein [Nocardioides anomalus]|uniref:Thioesterase family protein n=1 Tax=Nocardioides anomalus TaxID=2712223 RepID=A0A6G6WGG4_9ACTN|nr:thioesterase family protein [Nocardioides anomalus]QIG44324.1 thioesterase family protein [Nocardioides anomalus]
MNLPEAYYLPVGDDTFESTAATTSPWDLAAQHGGPPSALLARAVDRTTDDPGFTIARLTVDMLGAIPQGRVRTEAEVVRPGRRVEMVAARLYVDERLACTATAWRVREDRESTRHLVEPPAELPPLPEAEETAFFEGVPPEWGYGPSVDWRFVEGGFAGPATGRARLWTRVRIPLVAGEETAPLHRLVVVADSTNGVSARLPLQEWWSIPNTLTVTVERVPDEEWMFLDAATDLSPHGRGAAHATMSDRHGVLAHVAQPLLVSPR